MKKFIDVKFLEFFSWMGRNVYFCKTIRKRDEIAVLHHLMVKITKISRENKLTFIYRPGSMYNMGISVLKYSKFIYQSKC